MNNVIKAFLLSLSVATVSVQSAEQNNPSLNPNIVTYEFTMHTDSGLETVTVFRVGGKNYAERKNEQNGTVIVLLNNDGRRFCLSPVPAQQSK